MDNLAFEDHVKESENKDIKPISEPRICTFDEAAALCGTGRFHSILFLICGLCTLTLMASTLSIGFYIMFLKCDMDVSVYEQGLVGSTPFIGIVISSHTWGFLSDTWGRLKVIRISIYGAVTFAIISAFSVTTWMLIILRLLVGIFICGTQSSIFSYLSEFHSSKTRTQTVTYLSTFLSAALVILPALAIGILPLELSVNLYGRPFSSWRLLEIMCNIPGVMAALALLFLPESPKYLFTKGNHHRALNVLRLIYRINTGRSEDEYPVDKFSDQETGGKLKEVDSIRSALVLVWNQTAPMFQRSRIFVTLNLLAHIFISYFVAHGVFVWFPEILTEMVNHMQSGMTVCEIVRFEYAKRSNETGQSVGNLGCATEFDINTYLAMMAMGIVYTFVYASAGYMVKAVGKKKLLVGWILVAGVTGIAIVWSRNFFLTLSLFIGFLVVGVCGGIITTISVDYYPTKISAMAVCLIMMVGRLGVVAGSNSVGLIIGSNCEAVFYGFGSLVCALVTLSLLLPNNLSGQTIADHP